MKLIIGNFKMNLTLDEVNEYLNFFKDKHYENVIYAPSNLYLLKFIENGFKVASQDVSFANIGAYTGDVSALQLKSIGVNYSIIGHSERREYHDDDKYINEKLKMLLENDIIPILCIGETKEERDNKAVLAVLKQEIDDSFKNIDTNKLNSVIIAYEPIWSIGTGVIPTNDDITETVEFIKNYLNEKYNIKLQVLYGGSVNNSNINELEKIPVIDGYLVGGCSIKAKDFKDLIDNVR